MNSKPTIYISTKATDQTNQANVAAKLFDHVSHEAGQRVWDAPPHEWFVIAKEYVEVWYWDFYGTKFEAANPHMPLSPFTDAHSPAAVPATKHHMFPTSKPVSEGQSALARIKRFLGMR